MAGEIELPPEMTGEEVGAAFAALGEALVKALDGVGQSLRDMAVAAAEVSGRPLPVRKVKSERVEE